MSMSRRISILECVGRGETEVCVFELGCELSILLPSKVDAREKIRIGGSIDCFKAL
jgi:hypothetical protein